jgi:hypothetical protein
MKRKVIKSRIKWSLAVTVAVETLRKPEHLKAVLGHLGPFQYGTQAEALAGGHYIENGTKRFGLSREFAVELVEDTAKRFNVESHLERNAPRFKQVLENLSKTQRLANALASHLNSLDDITRHELQFAGASEHMRHQFEQVMREADVGELPRKSTDTCKAPRSLVERVTKLSSFAGITKANLLERRKKNNLSVDDVGGNTNLWKENVGIPRWGLVNDALWIYEAFKPGDAKATIKTRGFYQFVHDLYYYATGRKAAVHAKIDDWVKRLVKPHREDKEEEVKQNRLDVELGKLLDGGPETTKTARARVLKIKKEMEEIATRREALAQIMFPHVRLKPRPA